ncbi:MAG: Glu-tRNA(Gln) amidotransferase subunit GatD [Candidatus Micrarchaeia archaeon]
MYSSNLLGIFKNKEIEISDRIRIKRNGHSFEGILMPRSKEADIIVLKLDNGYNVGISSEGSEITLIKKGEKIKKEKETGGGSGNLSILGCGGTISSKVEYLTGAVYPTIDPKDFLLSFPELSQISTIKTRTPFSILSEDMNQEHWKIIAKETFNEINEGAKGIVLMHGTDTMHYTSAALSFMLQNLSVPVIMVGSQRSSDRPSSDNRINLINAAYCAMQDIGEVGVCMHAESSDTFCYLHRGTKVRKMHTSIRSAFKSINTKPIAIVDYSKKEFKPLIPFKKRSKEKTILDTKLNSNVALIQTYPGIKPEFIDSLRNYDGIVISATGLGHAPTNAFNDKYAKSILPNLKSLIDSEIPVVFAPQTIYGRLNFNVYSAGRLLKEIGVIGDGADWTCETAYVKLCFVLGHVKNPKKVEEMMMKNIAEEISEKISLEEEF